MSTLSLQKNDYLKSLTAQHEKNIALEFSIDGGEKGDLLTTENPERLLPENWSRLDLNFFIQNTEEPSIRQSCSLLALRTEFKPGPLRITLVHNEDPQLPPIFKIENV